MAFRTNKVPAIEERTVSGSSVSFNSAFALPLKACKVSFSSTESGSGTKSPSNPYTINGVSGLNLSANSVSVSVNFGGTYYGGEIDLLTGILTVTHEKVTYNGTERWTYREQSDSVYHIQSDMNKAYNLQNGNCNIFPIVDNLTTFGCLLGADNSAIYVNKVADLGLTNADEFKTWLTTHNMTVVYPLAEPTIIQLSANELSSIIGNNTFSTDTGTLEITFSDLQEKSASGSVATFNTALAMPLVECKTEFMCTQEGSGTVTPDNPRPFVPVNNVVLTANVVDITANFGSNKYGGYVDFVNKKINSTYKKIKINECSWFVITSGWFRTQITGINNVRNDILTEYYTKVTSYNASENTDMSIYKSDSNNVYIHDNNYSDATSFVNAMGDYGFVVQLTTPIVHDLSDIPTILAIIGNNSFASDSGSIELKYKDLDIAKRGNFREVFRLPS